MVRSVGVAGPGAAGSGAGGFRSADERVIAEDPLRHQEAGAGIRWRPDRMRSPGLTSAPTSRSVSFKFNSSGSRKFALATSENVGQPFAIVLDNEVISASRDSRADYWPAPARFPAASPCSAANDLAVCCAPAPCRRRSPFVEERTRSVQVFGQDSIEKETCGLCRLDPGSSYHAGDLPAVRRVRQYRRATHVAMIFRPVVAPECHADAARHRRIVLNGRHRGHSKC